MDGHKESILTLKNYGVCHKNKGNYEEARKLLEKAEHVAKRELDEDHMWKVMVKLNKLSCMKKKERRTKWRRR